MSDAIYVQLIKTNHKNEHELRQYKYYILNVALSNLIWTPQD